MAGYAITLVGEYDQSLSDDEFFVKYGLKRVILLSEEDMKLLVDGINNPPKPNEALKQLFKEYNK